MTTSAIPEAQWSAVHNLTGKILTTGWKVLAPVKPKPGATGGHFSVCYLVEKNGEVGFLKALNIQTFVTGKTDFLKAMAELLNTFNYEKEVLIRCGSQNLSKVSRLIVAEHEHFEGYFLPNVYYMIFEKADSDARNHIQFTGDIDLAWKLRSLHNIATGLKQLHGIQISHQDLKPSNVFVYQGNISKLGDLGRSLCQSLPCPHGDYDFAGDTTYAPPEFAHGFVLPSWRDKVFSIDCYLLGSMAAFYLTGQGLTALMVRNINSKINIYNLDFENALPYWQVAFDNALEIITQSLGTYRDKEELINVIRLLSNPDPRKRGHPKDHKNTGNKYNLERVVEIFNRLARRAEIFITRN